MMEAKYIPIVRKDETSKVFIKNVMLIEQELRKTMIYAEEGHYWRYGKIDELLRYLDGRFFRCHQSCIINMDKVVKMKEQTIFFENGFKTMMGREKFQCARQNFNRHIMMDQKPEIEKPDKNDDRN